ncbi:hypothetical protein ACQKIC_16130 [Peribacillus sp. NPDC046944]|uniref:hypothetical protein n=1 Tax=unclassified Peribacillus TaxID=2675266 RepID=UPI00381CD4DD
MGWGIMTNYASRSESFWIKETYQYLIDAGKTKNGEDIIKKYKCLFSNLDCFVISHGDEDHIGLANTIIEELEPDFVILSPLVYIVEKLRFTFNDVNLRFPMLFEGSYRWIETNEDNIFRVYSVKAPANILYPWDMDFKGKGIFEFETFPTKSANKTTILINDFISKISSYTPSTSSWLKAINTHKLIKDLRTGKLLDRKKYKLSKSDYSEMWDEIESAIIRKLKNEMSLICRVGSTFFTGDATRNQLRDIEDTLINQSELLDYRIALKINHHGSVNPKYKYFDFYKKMKPKQLLLKRDFQIQGSKTLKPNFIAYVNDLKSIVPKNGFIDSKKAEDKNRAYQKFNTF